MAQAQSNQDKQRSSVGAIATHAYIYCNDKQTPYLHKKWEFGWFVTFLGGAVAMSQNLHSEQANSKIQGNFYPQEREEWLRTYKELTLGQLASTVYHLCHSSHRRKEFQP